MRGVKRDSTGTAWNDGRIGLCFAHLMGLPIKPPYLPMEATSASAIPEGSEWQYEPKWDGFRCLAFRDGDEVKMQSKAGQPLERYFPEVVDALRAMKPKRFVLDGELTIVRADKFSFEDLLLRLHPAETRVRRLAAETPASFIIFDILVDERTDLVATKSLQERRRLLRAFSKYLDGDRLRLSPATSDIDQARRWLLAAGGAFDGVIAKRLDMAYATGERTGMQKIKLMRTADCVIGGFRYAEKNKVVGSLLLGLYDPEGRLNHVGFCSGIKAADKPSLTRKLERLIKPPGFTGRAPGGPSRWATKRSSRWEPLVPSLVVEVQFDHVSGERFRHGTRFLRWRPDKNPLQCRIEQLEPHVGSGWDLVKGATEK